MDEQVKNEEQKQSTQVQLICVTLDTASNNYNVKLAQGSNVAETAFAMSVVIRCLVRDGLVDSVDNFTNLIGKYATDPQFEEVKQ